MLLAASGSPLALLATILQFAEGLSDRQAAEAVRSRIDWKYVLRLELTDPGVDASVLCEFRCRLIQGEAEYLLFDTLLNWCRDRQLVKAGGRQRTDSTHILAAVRALNRMELVGETMCHALNHLAVAAPDWLQTVSQREWLDRYARRPEDDRLLRKQAAREALAWIGYKVHLTETCDDDQPHLITQVETAIAPAADCAATPQIHAALRSATSCLRHILSILGSSMPSSCGRAAKPTTSICSGQPPPTIAGKREGLGFDAQHFSIDWEHQRATCPEGETSLSWTPAVDKRTNHLIKIKFSSRDCRHCPSLAHCVRSKKHNPRRTITIRNQPDYLALQLAWQREGTPEFRSEYARRAGIEGTISRGIRTLGLRRTRYVGKSASTLGISSSLSG